MKLSKEGLTKEQWRYYKLYGRLPDPEPVVLPEAPTESNITVLCVRFGTKYGPDYVVRLRNMISRHLTVPYEFVCLTDDPTPIEGVKLLVQRNAGYMKPWWHKVHMFDPFLEIKGRILYLDLDVIVCNNINKLVTGVGKDFLGIQDFNRKFHPGWKYLNSSVMTWIHGSQHEIWDRFVANPTNAQRMHGDQDWIWHIARNSIRFFPQEWIQSYKWEIRNRDELISRVGNHGFKTVAQDLTIHPECSIAVFHGNPKPEDIADKFVIDNWR